MNIAFLTTRLTKYDAISNYSVDMLKKLSDSHHVDLYTFVTQTEIPAKVSQYNYTSIKDHNIKSVLFAVTKIYPLAQKLKKYNLLILYSPDIPALFSAHLAKSFNPNLKLIWDFQGITPIRYMYFKDKLLTSVRRFVSLRSMKSSNLILVRSESVKKEIEPYVNARKNRKILVTPLGIHLDRFNYIDAEEIRRKHNLYGRFVLLYVGRLVPSKQVDFLIKAIPNLSEDFLLVIVGSGIEKENLENLAVSLNVKDRVIFAGRVSDDDLPKYYASSNAFVTASLHEGFCVPIIESFASGKLAVVPNRASMPEVVADGGLIYDGSMEDFLSKLGSLKDQAVLDNISIKVNQIIKKYDVSKVSEEYLETIEKAMDGF
ncbi:glycosyltransferase [Methanosarcina sp. DH2]|uniref:glycosyltransferase family 4 protein n=1 Tax=Methanosarcina sp. DH2 TaxID=2605639 RepID=UPI001E2F54B5|nr:glycosyltransferase family 1 protein [Methanosarcina sp. DH2]MCC4770981.1 glycosyltransferase [Methanosarcina sp. DH2]